MNSHDIESKKDSKNSPIKLEEASYSTKEIEQIIYLQEKYKLKLSRNRFKKGTEKDIKFAINIDQTSKRNLNNVKERLKKADYLSCSEKKTIPKGHCLTEDEFELFKALVTRDDYTSTHTTSAILLKNILLSNEKSLLDSVESRRRGISPHTSTPDFCGQEANIFFTFGTSKSSPPLFTRQSKNPKTGKKDDYATVQLNLSKYQTNQKLIQGIWSSGHIYHYLFSEKNTKSPSIFIGDTEFYWQYGMENIFDKIPKRIKYLCFMKQGEGTIKLKFALEDEIASGNDIVPFFAYLFIERLRCVGGTVREHLLKKPDDLQAINILMEKLFRCDDFEIHIPTKLSLESKEIKIISPESRKSIAKAVSDAAAEGNIKKLIEYKSQDCPMEGHYYEDPFIFDGSQPIELPIVSSIKNKQYETVRWFINNGYYQTEFILKGSKLQDTNDGSTNAFNRIISALFELNDITMFKLFLENDFDFNVYYRSQMKKSFTEALLTQEPSRALSEIDENLATSDFSFLKAIDSASVASDSLHQNMIIEKIFPLFQFYQENRNKNRIVEMIASCGSQAILEKVIAINKLKDIDYPKLYIVACHSGNKEMVSYLKDYEKECKDIDYTNIIIKNICRGEFSIAEYFLKTHNKKINQLSDQEIKKIIHISTADIQEIVSWLAKEGLFEEGTKKQEIIINELIRTKQFKFAKQLIEQFKTNISDSFFSAALENNAIDFCDYLLKKSGGTFPDNPDFLYEAIDINALDVVRWALKKGFKQPKNFSNHLKNCMLSKEMFELITEHYTLLPKNLSGEIKDSGLIENYYREYSLMNIKNLSQKEQELKDIESEINKSYPLSLYKDAIYSCNLPLLNLLTKQYPIVPSIFEFDIIKLLYDGIASPHVPETVMWLVEHGVTIHLSQAIEVFFNRMKRATFNYDARVLRNFFDLARKLDDDERLSFRPLLDEAIEKNGTKILINAISYNQLDLIRSLIMLGALVNSIVELENPFGLFSSSEARKKITPLEKACEVNKLTIIKGLLEEGASPHLMSNKDRTCLHIACGEKKSGLNFFSDVDLTPNEEIIELLLEYDAPINLGGTSPLSLYLADSPKPSLYLVKLFLVCKADINYQKEGPPPLLAAIDNPDASVVLIEYLIQQGADITQQYKNKSIYDYVCSNRPELKALLDNYSIEKTSSKFLAAGGR